MKVIPDSLRNLIVEFSKLPGIGKKTAERLSIYILKTNEENVKVFSKSLLDLKINIKKCDICHSFIDNNCDICNNYNRNNKIICVVKDPTDIFLIEKTGYNGMYHVLNGLLSPLDGVTPEDLNIETLRSRLPGINEIVLGIEPSSEGDMTNLYLSKLFKEHNVKITRFARGMPIGSSLEYLDDVTLAHSIKDRVEFK